MISRALNDQLNSIAVMIERINDDDYVRSSRMLGNGTIGQHVRHVVESVQSMLDGRSSGTISYDHRKRDLRISGDRSFASLLLHDLIDRALHLDDCVVQIIVMEKQADSTWCREILFNADHAIHHMAMMRTALREFELDVVDDNFGKAPSTIVYEATRACG